MTLKEQSEKFTVMNLFKNSFASNGVHLLAMGFLVLMVRQSISMDLILNWGSILVCALLLSALSQTMFLRKHFEQSLNYKHWENIQAFTTLLISSLFAFAYAYIVLVSNASMWPMISLGLAMHVSCSMITSIGSKKLMLVTSLPICLALVASLIMVSHPQANIIAVSITFFMLTIVVVSLTIHSALVHGFEMQVNYKHQVEVSEKYKVKFEQSTIKDQQTHVFNRRFFDLMINEEIRRAKRAATSFSLAIIEIDCFEEYVKHYGDKKALKCLQSIAKIMADATPRGGEFLTRFDNHQFALMLPNVETHHAIAFASKMRDLINNMQIKHDETNVENRHTVSISVGITEFTPNNLIDVTEIIEQAICALQSARKVGRNNTQVFAVNIVPSQTSKTDTVDQKPAKPTLVPQYTNVA